MQSPERMILHTGANPSTETSVTGVDSLSLWDRMRTAMWLLVSAGTLSFIGFVFIAIGSSEATVLGANFGIGSVLVSPLVSWGLVLLGFGVMLGFFGLAVKGPSVEWSVMARGPPVAAAEISRPPGSRYACPGCGGDVYTSQAACPECGHALAGAQSSAA